MQLYYANHINYIKLLSTIFSSLSWNSCLEAWTLTQNNDDLHLASKQWKNMNVSIKKLTIDGVID